MTYAESCETALRLTEQWLAEYHGLREAQWSAACHPPEGEEDIQRAYRRGWERGRLLLQLEREGAHP